VVSAQRPCQSTGRCGLAEIHKPYRCHDRLLTHKQAVFDHLVGRWRDLFNISYDVLLDDLTSTYFEADRRFLEGDKRGFGYSRDHRPDCVEIVIALVVTPEGLPLAYEVLPGNTSDKTTLRGVSRARRATIGQGTLPLADGPRRADR
jgi:transposase